MKTVGAYLTLVALLSFCGQASLQLTARGATTGVVVGWGDNSFGQLNTPAGLKDVVSVAAGDYHSIALKADGTVAAWGYGSYNLTNVPAGLSNVVAVSGGNTHSLAVRQDGSVVAWGDNSWGKATVPSGITNAIAVAAGGSHSVVLRSDGTLIAWGANNEGQLDLPAGLTGVVAIAAGQGHTVALKSDGTVIACGDSVVSTLPAGLTNVTSISESSGSCRHVVALRADGSLVEWGFTPQTGNDVPKPVGLSNVVSVAAGNQHSIALTSEGSMFLWGPNGSGQCNLPPGLAPLTKASGGSGFTLAVRTITSPTVTNHPVALTRAIGASASFTVAASGTGPFSYQWLKNGTPINGANASVFVVNSVQPSVVSRK